MTAQPRWSEIAPLLRQGLGSEDIARLLGCRAQLVRDEIGKARHSGALHALYRKERQG